MPSDSELLLSYARHRSESAFAELVRAHIDVVYSAACRRVGGDPHAAAEITQEVFVSLARHAERLARHPVLNAWLHASTRNAAANFHRRERRRERQKQEVHAMQQLDSSERPAAAWESIRVVLDEALDALSDGDRQALILRFFEAQSYHDVGERLGLREEAARMRVGRALEKLRLRLQRRGISSTAAVLSGALSAHSVAGAPAGLATSITTAIGAASLTAVAPAAGLLYFMSITKVSATLAGLAVIAGAVFLTFPTERKSPPALVATPTPAPTPPSALPPDVRVSQLAAAVEDDQARRRATVSAELKEAADRITALRDMLARLPEQSIPELKLATLADWHVAVDDDLETTDDYRRALGKIRALAERRFAAAVQPALREYLKTNDGRFPTDLAQLQPFVGPEIEPAMLQRYRIVPATEIRNVKMGGALTITQAGLIDSDYDSRSAIGPFGYGSASGSPPNPQEEAILAPVKKAYRAAHPSDAPVDMIQLMPYASTPEQKAAVQKLVREQERQQKRR